MNRDYKGFFITLEGPEGSGKTSHIPRLVEHLRSYGLVVFPTREPGGTNIGEQIRDVIHSLKNVDMHPRTETLLYQAARAQIVEQQIRPRLEAGEIVISDRFFDSTIAYQGFGHQQDVDEIKRVVGFATGGLTPDFTVLMDVDIETGLSRKSKQDEWNRMDAMGVEFHTRVRNGYLEMAKTIDRFAVVDASADIDTVYNSLRKEVEGKLRLNGFIERPRFGIER